MKFPSLGDKRTGAAIVDLERRLSRVELAQRQIPSRFLPQSPLPPSLIIEVVQTAHGFVLKDAVYNNEGTWAKASTDEKDEDIAVVCKVVDADTVWLCLWGLICLEEAFDEGATYYLSETPGTMTTTAPEEKRAVLYAPGVSLGLVLGPTGVGGGDLGTRLAYSVIGRAEATDGLADDIVASAQYHVLQRGATELEFALLTANSFADGAITLAKIENLAGLSVLGRAANSSGVMAAITAGTDAHVLCRSGTSLAFGQVQTGGIANSAVTVGKLADLAGVSVLGRSANTTGAVAAITAGADDVVLRRTAGALGFGQVSSAMMVGTISAGGPTGTASAVPVITYDAAGRLTAVTTATITPAAIGAVDSATFAAHNHTLDALSNVTVTSKATNDVLFWSGSAWVNRNLGPIVYVPATGILGLGTAADPIDSAIPDGGRLFLASTAPIEWVLAGNPSTATEVTAKAVVVSGNVSFRDQGTSSGGTTGTETMLWTCSATAGNRRFDFKIATATDNRLALKGASTGDASLHIADNSYVRWFTGTPSASDIIASSPSTAHFRWEYSSSEALGSISGALVMRHSGDLTTKRVSINTAAELFVYYSATRQISLRLDAFVTPDGSAASAGASSATLDIRPREIEICEGGSTKKIIVLCSGSYT